MGSSGYIIKIILSMLLELVIDLDLNIYCLLHNTYVQRPCLL
jgi:hypothetical protein